MSVVSVIARVTRPGPCEPVLYIVLYNFQLTTFFAHCTRGLARTKENLIFWKFKPLLVFLDSNLFPSFYFPFYFDSRHIHKCFLFEFFKIIFFFSELKRNKMLSTCFFFGSLKLTYLPTVA